MTNRNYKVAIIDDDPSIVSLISAMLERQGYVVVYADDGDSGWDLVLQEKPDVIILDVMMPKVSGLELCQRIRKSSDVCGTYILMLTAKSQEADIVDGLLVGADDYMTKPFQMNELLARVETGIRQRTIHEELLRAEKSNSLGIVVGGISHHFNNLLGGIRSYLEMAQYRKDRKFLDTAIETAIYNLDIAALIVRNLSYYSGKAYLRQISDVNLDELLKQTLSGFRKVFISANIELSLDTEGPCFVGIDPEAFQNVLSNLIMNSIQAMSDGGHINVRLRKFDDKLVLEIEDDGCGIAQENMPYILDPFFSTKACAPVVPIPSEGIKGKDVPGHGLGLAVVQGIVHSHNGKIQVHSAPGKGTTVEITFRSE